MAFSLYHYISLMSIIPFKIPVIVCKFIDYLLHIYCKPTGQEILGNATYKVFFGCDGRSEHELAELYNLNVAEQDFILSKRKANGIVSIGSKRIRVNFDLGYKSEFLTGGGL